MYIETFKIAIFKQEVTTFYGSLNDFKTYLATNHSYMLPASIDHFTEAYTTEIIAGGKRFLYLFCNKSHFKDSKDYHLVRVISHEIVHLVDYILDYSGIRNDSKNNEPRAYITGHVSEEVFKRIIHAIENE